MKFKVEKILKKAITNFCYGSIPVRYISEFRPFDSAIVEYKNKALPIIVELSHQVSTGIELSTLAAQYLSVKEGDMIDLIKIFNISPASSLDVIVSKEDPKKSSKYGPINQKIKELFRYCYIVDGFSYTRDNYIYQFRINDINKKYCHLVPTTVLHFPSSAEEESYSLLGLEEAYQSLKETLEWPTSYPLHYKSLKMDPPKGILLTGPSGCGKTHLIRELAKKTSHKVYMIRGTEILSKFFGGSEQNLRQIFEDARKNQPSLILIDEIDAIAKKRTESNETEARIVSQLLSLMDGLDPRGNVVVVATTNYPNSIDSALRRPGRFDKEIEIKPPHCRARQYLIKTFIEDLAADNLDLEDLAERTNGYVTADIKSLCNEAKVNCLRRFFEKDRKRGARKEEETVAEDGSPQGGSQKDETSNSHSKVLKVERVDFEVALKKVRPSILRGYQSTGDLNITLQDVIGYEEVKRRLIEQITLPIKYPDLYLKCKVKKIKGIILTGPPGTGKTTLAKALAAEVNHNFMSIGPSDLLSKYVGETEGKITELFERARNSEPCIVFIDELDGLFGNTRDAQTLSHDISKTTQFLSLMDGLSSDKDNLIFIATTNKIELIDKAFLRSGRFELILKMGYPNKKELIDLYKHYFKDLCDVDTLDFASLSAYSCDRKITGSDMTSLKRILVTNMVKENIKTNDFSQSTPSKVTLETLYQALNSYTKYKHQESTITLKDEF